MKKKTVKKYQNGGSKKSQFSSDSLSVANNYRTFTNPKSSAKQRLQSEDNMRDVAERYSNSKLKTMGPAGKKLADLMTTPDYINMTKKKFGGSIKTKKKK